jgi:hypothetical protein
LFEGPQVEDTWRQLFEPVPASSTVQALMLVTVFGSSSGLKIAKSRRNVWLHRESRVRSLAKVQLLGDRPTALHKSGYVEVERKTF